jgi:uncharacterized protein (TIGR02246 family)
MSATEPTLDVRTIFERYAAQWQARDPDAIVALHTPDTEYWLRNGEAPVHGRDAVHQKFAAFFEQWPQFGFVVYRVITDPRHWVLDWALTSVLTGPDGTSSPVRFDCVDVVTVNDDGLVVRKDTFVDHTQAVGSLATATA